MNIPELNRISDLSQTRRGAPWSVVVCMLLSVAPLSALAQDQAPAPQERSDSPQTQGALLPEIDPQDIEIRSEFKARFPGVRRQPILGFNPRPRVFRIDPERMPFVESQEEVVANLPIGSLDRPEPPSYTPFMRPEPRLGEVTGGLGSLISPYLTSRFDIPLVKDSLGGVSTWLSSGARAGMLSDHSWNDQSSHAYGDLDLRLTRSGRDGFFLRSDLSGLVRSVEHPLLPATDLGAGSLPGGAAEGQDPYTRSLGGAVSLSMGRSRSAFQAWSLGVSSRLDRHDLYARSAQEIAGVDERHASLRFTTLWPSQRPLDLWRAGGSVDYSGQSSRRGAGTDPGSLHLRAGGQWERTSASTFLSLRTGVSTLAEWDSETGAGGMDPIINGSRLRVLPDVLGEMRLSPREWLGVGAGVKAAVQPMSVTSLIRENPHLNPSSPVSHPYLLSGHLQSTLTFFRRTVLELGAGAEWTWEAPVFHRILLDAADPARLSYFRISPEDTRVLSLHASVTQPLLGDAVWVEVEGVLRDATMFKGGGPALAEGEAGNGGGLPNGGAGTTPDLKGIPYQESVRLDGRAFALLLNRIEVGLSTQYRGERRTFSGERLEPSLLLSSQVRARITGSVHLTVSASNLLNRRVQVWDGIVERPFEVFGGISLDL